ncbi:MAG: cytochrome c-type biogenesis protein CcmH [Paracoccaceae bacterium]|nr:cytochrome c-type biogenesis protein CcmH [Paracoccaceae bacterium]
MIRALLLVCLLASPAFAVEPDEMLADPALEARANALDDVIRCVQCRSEAIGSSNADWARDARLVVRELIADGASDEEVLAFFVERYGEVVLMRPTTTGANLVLWLAAPAMLLGAGIVALVYLRRRSTAEPGGAALTPEEQARVDELLGR